MPCIPLLKQALAHAYPCFAATVLALISTLAQSVETTNKMGMTMIDIPAGNFQMGSCKITDGMKEEAKKRAFLGQAPLTANCTNADTRATDHETPQHRVSIRAFQLGKTEVTLGQFKLFIVAAGRSDIVNSDFMKYNAYGDAAPVVWVSWEDVQAFIAWLNKTDGGGYRLPSEAEWEYACRAGENHAYCGSNNLAAIAWYDENSGGHQHPVGSKQANAFGLHDMSGNAPEWVQDCWHSDYNGAPLDNNAWGRSKCEGGVLRGGFWFYSAELARAASRYYMPYGRDINFTGFRLARTKGGSGLFLNR